MWLKGYMAFAFGAVFMMTATTSAYAGGCVYAPGGFLNLILYSCVFIGTVWAAYGCNKLFGRSPTAGKAHAALAFLTSFNVAILPFVTSPIYARKPSTQLEYLFPVFAFLGVVLGGFLLQYILSARQKSKKMTPFRIVISMLGFVSVISPMIYAVIGVAWVSSLGTKIRNSSLPCCTDMHRSFRGTVADKTGIFSPQCGTGRICYTCDKDGNRLHPDK